MDFHFKETCAGRKIWAGHSENSRSTNADQMDLIPSGHIIDAVAAR